MASKSPRDGKKTVTIGGGAHPTKSNNITSEGAGGPMITDHLSDVRVKYHIQPKELGHGHYGVVRKCQHRETELYYAIKSIRKKKVGKIDVLKREIDILQTVDHPNIIKLHEVFEDEKYLHLVTELCTGGELFDRITAKTESAEGHYSEHDAAEILRSIIEAIRYCHDEKHICHRDLKPENFLFETKDEHSNIKIIDFGLSRQEDESAAAGMMKTKVGTPYYVAPEVLNKEYDKSCDMWSIGVIAYILLCGYPPFYGDNDHQIFESVRAARFEFPSPEWDDISSVAKEFIMSLLKKTPKDRLTASQALEHKWFANLGLVDKSKLPKLNHGSSKTSEFKALLGMNKLKKAAMGHIATSLTTAEVGDLQDIFRSIDVDGDGTLTVDELSHALKTGGFDQRIRHEIQSMLDTLKLDGNVESLNWKEFAAAMVDKTVMFKEDKIKSAFDYFDRSHRGSISVKDLKEVFGSEQQAAEIMGDIDQNGDGVISYDEFHKMMEEK